MGNQQGGGGNQLFSTCVPGRHSHPKTSRYRHPSLPDSESSASGVGADDDESAIECDDDLSLESDAAELENVIIANDTDQLKEICVTQSIDINLHLNEKGETALILAVKLSHIEMVKVLLSTPSCEINSINNHEFSALDVALITAFDNRLEPRQTICWEIIECLLQVGADPHSRDAMMYVVRTALKYCDEEFLYRLILLAQEHSYSVILHELLLQKLHRYQPVYIESLDPLLISVSEFTVKLLKTANEKALVHTVNSLVYYLESYWHSRTSKISTFSRLIIYATGAGWRWTPQQLGHLSRVCPSLGSWCRGSQCRATSLCHITRCSFRKNVQCLVPKGISELPDRVPDSIRDYLLLKDIDQLTQEEGFKINNVIL